MTPVSFNEIIQFVFWFFGPSTVAILIPILIRNWIRYYQVKDFFIGKVVLITGASSGLGEALSHAFYKEGCKLILAARRVDQLERVKNDLLTLQCKQETFTPQILELDVSDLSSLSEKAQTALSFYGGIDVLVNNAGISFRGKVEDTNMDVHMKLMMVNYFGQICLTKCLLPSMINKKKGHIVMISSVQGRISIPFRSAYAASKHALQAYSDCLRAEIYQHGIKLTVASPGYINTGLSLNALTDSGKKYGIMDATTASGYSTSYVARKILSGIKFEEKEILLTPLAPKLAVLLRMLCPSIYFYVMKKRAKKEDMLPK